MIRGFIVLFMMLISMTLLFSHESVEIPEIETVIDTDIVLETIVRDPEPHERIQTCRRRRCTC